VIREASLCLLGLLSLPARALPTIQPDAFNAIAKTSVNILLTQRHYLDEFETAKPEGPQGFYLYFDLNYDLPTADWSWVSIPVSVGDMQGELRKGRLGVDVGYKFNEYSFGIYDIAEGFSLSAPRARNPGFAQYYSADSSAAADVPTWNLGYQIFAFTLARQDYFHIALGLFSRNFPLVGDTGAPRFLLQPGDSGQSWQGSRNEFQGYADLDIHGYDFSSLYTLGGTLDLIGFRKRWPLGDAQIQPTVNYFRYRRRWQAGMELTGYPAWRPLELGGEVYGDSRLEPEGERAMHGHAEAKAHYRLWPLTGESGARRFHFAATASGGFSSDALEQGVWGHAEGLAFENVFKVLQFSLERSENEPCRLLQMPLRNAVVWSFDFKVIW
jgi:hypothetical protein